MKIRQGWVSNSSSSSFLIAWRDGDLVDKLEDALKISRSHPFSGFMREIAEKVAGSGDEITTEKDLKKFAAEHYIEEGDDEYGRMKDLLVEGWSVRVGEWSDDNYDGIEQFLCNNDFNVDRKDLIVEHSGGY